MIFKNREAAGKLLGNLLKTRGRPGFSTVVLGIPRGGAVVGKKVAKILNCPLDVIVVKKLGAPGQSELAIGAIGEINGSKYINEKLSRKLGLSIQYLGEEIKRNAPSSLPISVKEFISAFFGNLSFDDILNDFDENFIFIGIF